MILTARSAMIEVPPGTHPQRLPLTPTAWRRGVMLRNHSKPCIKCDEVKPLGSFNKNRLVKDGHLNTCKDCQSDENRAYRQRNLNDLRAYDRNRSRKDPQRIACLRTSTAEWAARNPDKRRAQLQLQYMVKKGRIVKQPCARLARGGCSGPINGHHEDYSKPLDVVWLCAAHHSQRHREMAKEGA